MAEISIVDDETHAKYYWNTIDKSKKYHVRVTEYSSFSTLDELLSSVGLDPGYMFSEEDDFEIC